MGFSTIKHKTNDFPVPNEWIFENFLNLPEKLGGQSVSIKSIFNKADTNPSMIIYLHNSGRYKFNDFSSGISGDGVDLIQKLFKLKTRQDAFNKALELYQSADNNEYEKVDIIKTEKNIVSYEVREWNEYDVKYWTAYKLDSSDLDRYNVKALSSYTFEIKSGDNIELKTFNNTYSYGFFRKDDSLYKIYNPKNKIAKFIKVKNYIQGHDQLKLKYKWLMICSSLKDAMAFSKLKLPIECIAPDSENTMLSEKQINLYKSKYKIISVLFDNDTAGKKAALKYKEMFDLPIVNFDVEKDLAECIKQHGIKNTKLFIKPLLLKIKNEIRKSV
jgi:hypothetical protein